MSIPASIAAHVRTLACEAYVDGRRVTPLSGSVELGLSIVSASATLVLAAMPSWADFRQSLEIRLGWDGRTQTVFRGVVEEITRTYSASGFTCTLHAVGRLRALQYQYHEALEYVAQTDGEIINDLLDRVGLDHNVSIDTASQEFGAVRPVTLPAGSDPWSLVDQIDQVLGYRTFDTPGGTIMRRRISGHPAGSAALEYVEGENIFMIGRPRTIRALHNAVFVTGLPQAAFTPFSSRLSPSPYVPDPPGYVGFDFTSELIETNELAEATSERLMLEVNRVLEQTEWETVGDPRLVPGMTVAVDSGRLGLDGSDSSRFFLDHITHRFGADGWVSTLRVQGGAGEAGFETDLEPVAVFTWTLTRETYEVAGVPTDMLTVTADGSASYDPDGTVTLYAWANSVNADVSSVTTYATAFTEAEVAAGPTITLTVTDNHANTGATTQTITDTGQTVLARDLYVAAGGQAEATNDGGATWQTWTAPAAVVSTPIIAGEDHSYLGLANGALYRTDDYLATAPVLVHSFGSQVNCIWIHEANADRVTVGLANGQVWNTVDASALGASSWNQLADFPSSVLDIVESRDLAGEYRVATGQTVIITVNEFASQATLIDFGAGATARAIVPTMIGLPGIATATAATDPVQAEDGTAYTFAGTPPVDVRAGTHHIRQQVIWVGTQTGQVWTTQDGGTELSLIATLAGGDPINRLVRDGDHQTELYAAANDGLWKSYTSGVGWARMRGYAGGGLTGYQCGYGGLRPLPVAGVTLESHAGEGKALGIGIAGTEPDGWRAVGFDDSAWTTPVAQAPGDPWTASNVGAAEWISFSTSNQPEYYDWLYRREVVLGPGAVTAAHIDVTGENWLMSLWVNNVNVAQQYAGIDGFDARDTTHYVLDPGLFLPGQTNVIAARVRNGVGEGAFPAATTSLIFRLEVS